MNAAPADWACYMSAEYGIPEDGLAAQLIELRTPLWREVEAGQELLRGSLERLNYVDLDGVAGELPPWLVEGTILRGLSHRVFGQPEGGKTMWATRQAAEVLKAGGCVFWIDMEMTPDLLKGYLLAHGVEDFSRLHYFREPPLVGDKDSRESWVLVLKAYRPDLVVADAQAGVLAAADMNENSSSDVLQWDDMYFAVARRELDAATLMIDHTGHENQERERGASGKKAAAKIQFLIVKTAPFDKQVLGQIRVGCTKNTPSAEIPKVAFYAVGGTPLTWEETAAPSTEERVLAQEASDEEREEATADKVLFVLADEADGLSGTALENAVGGNHDEVRRARNRLVDDGFLVAEKRNGRGGGMLFRTSPNFDRAYRASSPATPPGATTSLTLGGVGEVPKPASGEVGRGSGRGSNRADMYRGVDPTQEAGEEVEGAES